MWYVVNAGLDSGVVLGLLDLLVREREWRQRRQYMEVMEAGGEHIASLTYRSILDVA